MKFLFILFPLLCVVSAREDHHDVIDVMRNLQLRSLVQLLEVADLTPSLEDADSCTVFAPSDAAFAKIPDDIKKQLLSNPLFLREVLAFHASPKEYMSTDLKNNQLLDTLLKGFVMRINIYPSTNTITADGSPVSNADNKGSNGVVHVVDQVLYPFPTGTVDSEISHNDNLTVLNTAVEKADLASALDGEGPFTLFAPTNDAFSKLPNGTLPSLLKNVTALTEVLTYHVVSGVYYPAGLSDGEKLKTLQKGSLVCHVNAKPGSESCTVFAPTDEAFSNLPADVRKQLREGRLLLLEVLMFHVSPNTTMSTSWKNNYIVATLLEYLCSIRINIYPSTRVITADGSVISNPDNRASNGVVHVINQVLYPQPIQSIAKEIDNIKQLKELSRVVEKAGFGRILNDAGPLTFFAPTDDAFQKLPDATLQNLLKNVTALTEVLSYHTVSGVYYKAGLSDGQELMTLQSGTLECHVRHTPGSGSQVEVNEAKIVGLSVPALNGVMHVIDTVLFPPK
ncbi:PREDICTED: transforming growth factor-beta-induced protein ig-h3-like [Branchiostoma belcheri]|uniref:Transforming growth factor-beta-induced protein ig-h3-like n=1 Tax=Branchiostoma belcheri TaxID=7741 RepID=A0A6P4ZYG8_BRABE|nr:PREDICTED: transforming growth factor-beta-induced protein ig-h3-like [Branchiostoma belcheri]